MNARAKPPEGLPQADASDVVEALRRQSFPYFMSRLAGPDGQRLSVARPHKTWSKIIPKSKRLVLVAPRDHGKTWTLAAYILWKCYVFAHPDPTDPPPRPGTFEAVVLSATAAQAKVFLEVIREMLLANEALFGPVGPRSTRAARRRGEQWSAEGVRLPSGARIRIRAFRTSTRGLHPSVLVLDDPLSDLNTGSQHQRDLSWRHLTGTLFPMHPQQILIVGTPLHQDDLLHRLAPHVVAGAAEPAATYGFEWRRYRALNKTGGALWPARHSAAELTELRDADPLTFSREYQGEPLDEVASLFPYPLTQRALDAGREQGFLPAYHKQEGEMVLLGVDFAISSAARADETVVIVVAYDHANGLRRVLTAARHKGLTLHEQVEMLADLCWRFEVNVGIVEANAFQAWALPALRDHPGTRGLFSGHATTAIGKADVATGIPALLLALQAGLWVMPSSDGPALEFARLWQAELAAFGYHDGKLHGVGEHDDAVMATWFIERAVRIVAAVFNARPIYERVLLSEELGYEPVRIGTWNDAVDALVFDPYGIFVD